MELLPWIGCELFETETGTRFITNFMKTSLTESPKGGFGPWETFSVVAVQGMRPALSG